MNLTLNREFILIECPDMTRNECTADLRLYDEVSNEELIVEVKRAFYGFEDKNEKALLNGTLSIDNLINKAVNKLECEMKEYIINNFIFNIEPTQFVRKDSSRFIEELASHMKANNQILDKNPFEFIKRRGDKIRLTFSLLANEIIKK